MVRQYDYDNFILNVLEVIPQEQMLDSLRLFAREVMPHFKDDRRIRRRCAKAHIAAERGRRRALMPPRYGKLAVSEWGKSAPIINGYRTDPWKLNGARLLEFRYEIDDESADALLPPALHPAMPAYATFAVIDFPDSPIGHFSVGEVRIVGRAGGRPAAFVASSFCDSAAACQELSARRGYPVTPADVALTARHYDIVARVSANGHSLLELELRNRRPLPSLHLQPLPSMNLACNREDGRLVLVQVDIEAVFAQSDGGSERAIRLDPNAFRGSENIQLMSPMSSAFAIADLTLARIQVICDPERPAESGTTYLD